MKAISYPIASRAAFAFATLALWSCADPFENIETPDGFGVTAEKATYKVGEAVQFKLNGTAEFITFYSGEDGHNYDWRNKERFYDDEMILSFKSAQFSGNNQNCGKLMYSQNFIGLYEVAWAKQATWTDITDRFVYPVFTAGTPYILYDSGDINIEDMFDDPDLPLYFCWYFTTEAGSNRTRFRVHDWVIKGAHTGYSYYDFTDCQFRMIQGSGFLQDGSETYFPRVEAAAIVWDGIYASTAKKEGWAISAPIHYSAFLNAGKDMGEVIKTIEDARLYDFNYYFSEPGEYTATFVGYNVNANGRKEVVRQVRIKIEPQEDTPEPEETDMLNIYGLDGRAIELAGNDLTTVKKFNIHSTKQWTLSVVGNPAWLSVTPAIGNGGNTYTISVKALEANPGGSRTATVEVVSGSLTDSFTVTQLAQ